MQNKSFKGKPAEGRGAFARSPAVALMAVASIMLFSGCSSKTDDSSQAASVTASNVTLTAAQRPNVHLYTVASSRFHKTVEATGAVDFDNDQATSVLAPISGPVSRLLVSPGDKVSKGQPLATVVSPDYAAAI